MKTIIKPDCYSVTAAVDASRPEFNSKHESLAYRNIHVDYIFIGDEIAQSWELPAFFNQKRQTMVMRAVEGETLEFLSRRFEADVLQLEPKYCVIEAGIHDSWTLEFNMTTQALGLEYESVLETAEKRYHSLFRSTGEYRTKLIACSLLPNDGLDSYKADERNDFIIAMNAYIKKLCAEYDAIYVDFYSAMVQESGYYAKEGLLKDGLVPNTKGYQVMADVLKKTLEDHDILI